MNDRRTTITVLATVFVLGFSLALCAQAQVQRVQTGTTPVSLADLQLVNLTDVPTVGTFWSLRYPDDAPFPCPIPGLDVYSLGNGEYVTDDTSDSAAASGNAQVEKALRTLEGLACPMAVSFMAADTPLSPADTNETNDFSR